MKRLGALALLLVCGCFPFEPGSDLKDVEDSDLLAPPKMDMPTIPEDMDVEMGADITGTFDVAATLKPPVGEAAPLNYVFVATQTGAIESKMATVSLEVRDPMAPDMMGPSTANPSPIAEDGTFQAIVEGLVVKKDFAPDVFAEDAMAKMEIDAKVITSNCFAGTMKVTLLGAKLVFNPATPMDIELNGNFSAGRKGTSGCAADMPDMGMPDMGTNDMGDM